MAISPDEQPGDQVYARLTHVVWRLTPDRVLVRRVWPEEGRDDAADLLGSAAMVWVALDHPGTAQEVRSRLAEADQVIGGDELESTLQQLTDHGWLLPASRLSV